MRPYHRELGLETPLVAYNGVLEAGTGVGEMLFHQPLVPDAARALVAYLRREHPELNLS
jgi:hydroxymethylpyrimidine pyrophosphatase-like HAD family hydrolase